VQSQATQAAENGVPYCWTCAGHIII
jgi:hypothetical protein